MVLVQYHPSQREEKSLQYIAVNSEEKATSLTHIPSLTQATKMSQCWQISPNRIVIRTKHSPLWAQIASLMQPKSVVGPDAVIACTQIFNTEMLLSKAPKGSLHSWQGPVNATGISKPVSNWPSLMDRAEINLQCRRGNAC